MKKLLFMLLIFSLSLGFIGCSNDDDEKEKKEKLQAEYIKLVCDIIEYEIEVNVKQAEYDAAIGGRKSILRDQLDHMLVKLTDMYYRKRELERKLGISFYQTSELNFMPLV